MSVTIENVEEYVEGTLDVLIGRGVRAQAEEFRDGFSKVFPIADLQIFTADELVVIFWQCGGLECGECVSASERWGAGACQR